MMNCKMQWSHDRLLSLSQCVTILLLRNDPLEWRESEMGLGSVQKARFRDMEDAVVGQQRFVAIMQGWTATFSIFSEWNVSVRRTHLVERARF
jgi:hypothetical protein